MKVNKTLKTRKECVKTRALIKTSHSQKQYNHTELSRCRKNSHDAGNTTEDISPLPVAMLGNKCQLGCVADAWSPPIFSPGDCHHGLLWPQEVRVVCEFLISYAASPAPLSCPASIWYVITRTHTHSNATHLPMVKSVS